LLVDRARQHHLDDFDGGLVGDPQPGGEFRLDAEAIEHAADLRPPPCTTTGLMAVCSIRTMSRAKLLAMSSSPMAWPPYFHHHDLLVVALHVRQRLRQDAGDIVGLTAMVPLELDHLRRRFLAGSMVRRKGRVHGPERGLKP